MYAAVPLTKFCHLQKPDSFADRMNVDDSLNFLKLLTNGNSNIFKDFYINIIVYNKI